MRQRTTSLRRIPLIVTVIVAAAVLLIDQVTKAWAVDALGSGRSQPLVGDLIRFELTYNTGAAFSSGTGATWVFTVVSGLAAVAIIVFASRVRSYRWAIGLGVLLGGAASHFGDRLLRGESLGNGYVIDFIDYFGLFIGNVADIAIVGAVVYLAILAVWQVPWRDPARPSPTVDD